MRFQTETSGRRRPGFHQHPGQPVRAEAADGESVFIMGSSQLQTAAASTHRCAGPGRLTCQCRLCTRYEFRVSSRRPIPLSSADPATCEPADTPGAPNAANQDARHRLRDPSDAERRGEAGRAGAAEFNATGFLSFQRNSPSGQQLLPLAFSRLCPLCSLENLGVSVFLSLGECHSPREEKKVEITQKPLCLSCSHSEFPK